MIDALIFLLDTFAQLYLLILLLRFWLPLLRANFRNAVAQGVLRFTSPLIVPLRRFIPAIGRVDTATVIVAFAIQFAVSLLMLLLARGPSAFGVFTSPTSMLWLVVAAFVNLAMLSVVMFIVAIVIRVILNLLGRYFGPLSDLLVDMTEPLLRPVRKIIPPLGVIDLSAYIVIVLLIALNMALADLLPQIR
ncbi:MAG: YggT family protein [Gammaproteobacteria bacterium]|nr:YggT family protein [Gammaproteobacteria bacterium]MDH5213264.1 YggT family protein [Gammaproteobacteria bacterium]